MAQYEFDDIRTFDREQSDPSKRYENDYYFGEQSGSVRPLADIHVQKAQILAFKNRGEVSMNISINWSQPAGRSSRDYADDRGFKTQS